MKRQKKYSISQVLLKLNNLPLKKRIVVLYDALDHMQQYNGRTKAMCIALAMGYYNREGDNDSFIKITNQ